MPFTERKTAEAAVKAAEKTYEAVAKRADVALEKAKELNGERNRAARALNYAKANPDLYDDDPLSVVEIGQAASDASSNTLSFTVNTAGVDAAKVAKEQHEKLVARVKAAGREEPPVAEEPPAQEEPADDAPPPWQAPPATKPAAKRVGRPRTKAAEAAPEPPAPELAAPNPEQEYAADGTPIENDIPFNPFAQTV